MKFNWHKKKEDYEEDKYYYTKFNELYNWKNFGDYDKKSLTPIDELEEQEKELIEKEKKLRKEQEAFKKEQEILEAERKKLSEEKAALEKEKAELEERRKIIEEAEFKKSEINELLT